MKALVEHLIRDGMIKSERVAAVMSIVDRSQFVPIENKALAYEDMPLPINYNVTISAPHMHAYCMSEMESKLVPGARVLDVGSGSGYLCATFYEMCKDPETKRAHIVGIEHIDGLAQWSITNLTKNYKA